MEQADVMLSGPKDAECLLAAAAEEVCQNAIYVAFRCANPFYGFFKMCLVWLECTSLEIPTINNTKPCPN
jgi:hypothetical protein